MNKFGRSLFKAAGRFSTTQEYIKEKGGRILRSTLGEGVTVVTESETFPHQVDLGILIDAGTRDEVFYKRRELGTAES